MNCRSRTNLKHAQGVVWQVGAATVGIGRRRCRLGIGASNSHAAAGLHQLTFGAGIFALDDHLAGSVQQVVRGGLALVNKWLAIPAFAHLAEVFNRQYWSTMALELLKNSILGSIAVGC
jgi:hypothetical protein